MMRNRWTREEVIVAYALYCVTPFSKINNSNKEILKAAERINHSAASLKMRMCNIASLDPDFQSSGRAGLGSVAKLDREVFDEFRHDWQGLSEQAEQIIGFDLFTLDEPVYQGPKNKPFTEISAKQQRKFFRKAVLASYDYRCCISGVTIPELLIASHIKPWEDSDEKTERANPANGLCLNAFYDKAFDQGLFTVDSRLQIWVSPTVRNQYSDSFTEEWLYNLQGESIARPRRFRPNNLFLEYHNDTIFRR